MLQTIWNTRGYLFWLLGVSLFCLVLERIIPWRRGQKLLRRQFSQDVFWLFFNGHYAGIVAAHVAALAFSWTIPAAKDAYSAHLLASQPAWFQFVAFFLLKDLMEWGIHNLLHRVPWLWEFHKLHHTIEELDWIGNFRFHWMEVVVYRGLTYFPLVALGVDEQIILAIVVFSTLIGNLNHSNLNITWGPLRYILNSPRMHVWHHDCDLPADRSKGVNFGTTLSVWDWIFGTVYWPKPTESPPQQPKRLGFNGMEQYPQTLLGRFLFPFSRLRRKTSH